MNPSPKLHPHDIGLSPAAVRTRRRSHRLALLMIAIALITAAAGWTIYFTSVFNAMRIKDQPPSLAIVAYVLLIISSVTLVLGLWYMLRAQVERIARIADANELSETPVPAISCPHCHCHIESPDRFCRHCGKSLNV